MSYREFRLEKKLEFAKELLRDSAPSISDIATRLGYTSRRKFEQAFKQRFEQTPAQFRAATIRHNSASNDSRIAAQGLDSELTRV